MNITIGVLAHVDAGKTTFSESLLYYTNTITNKGRVDFQSSFLDNHEIEKNRGITIFTEQAVIKYNNNSYYLVDTPGHIDFSTEMERAIKIMDYAIIILSAVEGVQGHTETVFYLLKKHKIPIFFFINKIDRAGANINKVIQEIHDNLSQDVCFINNLNDKNLFEFSAMYNEQLLDLYSENNFSKEIWHNKISELIANNEIHICQSGSALKDIGVKEFFDTVTKLANSKYNSNTSFSCRVFKISHDNNNAKVTHLKIMSGKLAVRNN